MDLGLSGKAALVTGASRGIGLAIAHALTAEGCRLVICARGRDGLEAARRDLAGAGRPVVAVACDLGLADDRAELARQAVEAYGRIDVLVNNVGGAPATVALEAQAAERMEALERNVWSGLDLVQRLAPGMRDAGGGAVVFIGSIWGRESGGAPLYNLAKAAEISLARSLARELASWRIRVNVVAPGSILFPGGSWARRQRADPEGIADFVRHELPWGRFGRPEEVAAAVAFLASERASWITGACLTVDGGQSRSLI